MLALFLCVGVSYAFPRIKIGGVYVADSNIYYLQYVRHMSVPIAVQSGSTWEAGSNVSGKTDAEIQGVVNSIKALETDIQLREIYDRLMATPNEVFEFTNVIHAKAVVRQRLETIKMMRDFNADYRYTYLDNSAHPASTTAARWRPGSGTKFLFRQIAGAPYDAITELCDDSSKTYGECMGAIIACIWWGAAQAMGQASFNNLYPDRLDMDFSQGKNKSPFRNTAPAIDFSVHVPGDWVYFKNYNYAQVISNEGEFALFYKKGWLKEAEIYYLAGENSLYFGDGKYEGLGISNKTVEEMREVLMKHYNSDLAVVITEVGKMGGVYGASKTEIVSITPVTAPAKITAINIRRLTCAP